MDLQGLELQVDGVRRTLAQWTWDFVDSYYPQIGVEPYRVPAQHFNRQTLQNSTAAAGGDEGGVEQFAVLKPPMPCIAAGDLAHTQVLDGLEELSHQLKQLNQGPLFIISSVNYDNYLAKLQQTLPRRKRRKKKAATSDTGNTPPTTQAQAKRMRDNFADDEFPPEGEDVLGTRDETVERVQGKQPLMPPRPADRGGQRGEIDVLVLHERCGVVLMEVKSTGYPDPSWTPSEAAIERSVQKAAEQLDSACDVLHYIMPDLTLTPLTLVVALPFLKREQVEQAVAGLSLDPRLWFLCKEDLLPYPSQDSSSVLHTSFPLSSLPPSSPAAGTASEGSGAAQKDPPVSTVMSWWRRNVDSAEMEAIGFLETMRIIVGRICGLMSVVSVWTSTKPRVEVRTEAQAIGEAGRRVSDIVLLPRQADLLDHPGLQRVWLTGPMGSGKTLMLQLKGRQWVREGRRVVVINVRTTARGRPIGHALEEGIRQGSEGHPGAGSVYRLDVALDVSSMEALHQELAETGSMENACFVVDEVLSDMSVIAEQMALRYPDSPVWCVASYAAPIPPNFQVYRLGAVLRNPPSIQLMLKELDLNPRHKDVYTTRSAARGLPCDGPAVIFIEHAKHTTGVRHLDCLQCAHELADILETKLGLQLHPPADSASSESDIDPTKLVEEHKQSPCTPKSTQRSKTVEAGSLSFRDVLILSSMPFATYEHISGYHWEPHIPEVLKYMMYMGKSRFLAGLWERGVPAKVAVDNTMKEIVFPPKDEVIIAEVMGVHSLERKVIVFMRGGGPLTEEEVSQNLSRYRTMQAASQTAHQPESECTTAASSLHQDPGPEQDTEALSEKMILFASLMYEVRDHLYPQLPTSLVPTPENAKMIIHTLLGNMMVSRTQSFVEGTEREGRGHRGEDPEVSPADLRVGAEIRGHLPMLRKRATEENSCENQPESSERVLEADSVFLVPDVQEDVLGREGEVRRVRQALRTLSEDDQDWEFFAASRCLSQYISILP